MSSSGSSEPCRKVFFGGPDSAGLLSLGLAVVSTVGFELTEDGLGSSKEKVGSSRHFKLVVCLPVSFGFVGAVLLSFLSFCSFSSPLVDGSVVPLTLAVEELAVTYLVEESVEEDKSITVMNTESHTKIVF